MGDSIMNVKVIADIHFTEDQARHAFMEFALKNEELSELVKDKEDVIVVTDWQTNKWSDPNAIVHFRILEKVDEPSEDSENQSAPENKKEAGE